jgi:hypothetical protein
MQGRNARRLEALSRRPSRSPGFDDLETYKGRMGVSRDKVKNHKGDWQKILTALE